MTSESQTPDEATPPPEKNPSGPEEMIKVLDRRGNVKVIPRSQYDARKRRRRRRDQSKSLPLKEVLSVLIIVIVILIASYIALHLAK